MNPKDMATLEANLILNHVIEYLGKKSYASDNGLGHWYRDLAEAIALVKQAQEEVNAVAVEPVRIIDVILVDSSDLTRIAFKILKASIADENVGSLLPFATSGEYGDNYIHIVNESLYSVQTKYHVIKTGDTLCARGSRSRGRTSIFIPTCPGCLAKAKGVIVNHLLSRAKGDYNIRDYIRVSRTLEELQK